MHLLYYWRGDNYRRDLDMGVAYHLNQANPLLHQIEKGESLWAFTSQRDGQYALAAELVIKAKTVNPPNFHYGKYRVWGDVSYSRYFHVADQANIEPLIRSLSCKTDARILGHSFQGYRAVRIISEDDHHILKEFAKGLSPELRSNTLPEPQLETLLFEGNVTGIDKLIRESNPGIALYRQDYLRQQAPTRNRQLVRQLSQLYSGKCQICQWDPVTVYGTFLCHAHHIHWLSRGGEDNLQNMILVCPNHHEAIHKIDAPLDYQRFAFDFGSWQETILLDRHLRYS